MPAVFEILPESIDTLKSVLVFEISDDGLSWYFQDNETKVIQGLSVYHFPKDIKIIDLGNALMEVLSGQSILANSFYNIQVCYSFNQSVLLPEEIWKPALSNDIVELVHGDLISSELLTDFVSGLKLYNAYKIPSKVHKVIKEQFPNASFIHEHSVLLQNLKEDKDIMDVIFYPRKIVVRLMKGGKLQIIQSINYLTSEDAVYQLLNICNLFEVKDVQLRLGGMIEKNSPLFKEIHKYFLFIDFMELGEVETVPGIKELPEHYFSHLFSISRCA